MLIYFQADVQAVQVNEKEGTTKPVTLVAGRVYELKKTKQDARTIALLASYWIMIKSWADNMSEHNVRYFYECLLDDLAINSAIDVDLIHEMLKRAYGIESVAMHRLSQDAMRDYVKYVKERLHDENDST